VIAPIWQIAVTEGNNPRILQEAYLELDGCHLMKLCNLKCAWTFFKFQLYKCLCGM